MPAWIDPGYCFKARDNEGRLHEIVLPVTPASWPVPGHGLRPTIHDWRYRTKHSRGWPDLGLRSLDTRVGIYQVTQRVMEGRIPGVCLCRDGGLRRLGDGQKLLWYWNP